MCHPDSCANATLWKAVFQMSFDVNCDRVQDLETRGYFSLFRIMIKVRMLEERPNIQGSVGENAKRQRVIKEYVGAVDKELMNIILTISVHHCGQCDSRKFSGTGTLDGCQSLRIHLPGLIELIESQSFEDCFRFSMSCIVDIFLAIPPRNDNSAHATLCFRFTMASRNGRKQMLMIWTSVCHSIPFDMTLITKTCTSLGCGTAQEGGTY